MYNYNNITYLPELHYSGIWTRTPSGIRIRTHRSSNRWDIYLILKYINLYWQNQDLTWSDVTWHHRKRSGTNCRRLPKKVSWRCTIRLRYVHIHIVQYLLVTFDLKILLNSSVEQRWLRRIYVGLHTQWCFSDNDPWLYLVTVCNNGFIVSHSVRALGLPFWCHTLALSETPSHSY